MRSIASITADIVSFLRLCGEHYNKFSGDGYCRGENLPLLLEAAMIERVEGKARRGGRLAAPPGVAHRYT